MSECVVMMRIFLFGVCSLCVGVSQLSVWKFSTGSTESQENHHISVNVVFRRPWHTHNTSVKIKALAPIY